LVDVPQRWGRTSAAEQAILQTRTFLLRLNADSADFIGCVAPKIVNRGNPSYYPISGPQVERAGKRPPFSPSIAQIPEAAMPFFGCLVPNVTQLLGNLAKREQASQTHVALLNLNRCARRLRCYLPRVGSYQLNKILTGCGGTCRNANIRLQRTIKNAPTFLQPGFMMLDSQPRQNLESFVNLALPLNLRTRCPRRRGTDRC
jgi:hypothetical protein